MFILCICVSVRVRLKVLYILLIMLVILQIIFYIAFFLGFILFFIKNFLFAFIILYIGLISLIFVLFKDNIEKILNKKVLSYQERLEIKRLQWKTIWHHPKYYNIISFWKEDFVESYKNAKWPDKIWHPFLLVSISFYTASCTRFVWIYSILFFFKILIYILSWNFCSLKILLIFYAILCFITLVAICPLITTNIKKTYGPNCLKKLGFNGPKIVLGMLTRAAQNPGKTAAQVATGIITYQAVNQVMSDHFNTIRLHYKNNQAKGQLTLYHELQASDPNANMEKPKFFTGDEDQFNVKLGPDLVELGRDGIKFIINKWVDL
jgi:MFS family permease